MNKDFLINFVAIAVYAVLGSLEWIDPLYKLILAFGALAGTTYTIIKIIKEIKNWNKS